MTVQHYHGSCQCGAVDFDVDLDISGAVTCNCSRCQRVGSVLAFAPISAFTLNKGDGATTEYRFNKKQIAHQFCKICGIQTFSYGQMPDGSKTVAINLNCLDGIDPRAVPANHYDGAAM